MLMLGCFSVFAQDYTVKGIVKDSTQVIAFANVILTDSNGEMKTGTITEEDGSFNLTTQQGTYTVTVSFLGYQTWKQTISVDQNLDLGIISLNSQDNELGEVVVTAEKPLIERKADRLVFNVRSSVFANGVSADELLKNVPRIDPTSDGLSIIGKSSVQIMINERLLNLSGDDLKNYLKSLRSENIEKIEVITNPSAKYDAAGNSGLINIKLKKNSKLGFDGYITSTYTQRTKPSLGQSLKLNYSTEKLILEYNIYYGNDTRNIIHENEYIFENDTRISDEDTERQNKGLSNSFNMDYKVSTNSNLGFYFNYNDWDNDLIYTSKVKYRDNDNNIYRTQSLPSQLYGDYKNLSISPYYDIQLDTVGSKLKLNYNYVSNKTDSKNSLVAETFSGDFETMEDRSTSQNNVVNDFKINSLNIDFEFPWDSYKLDTGFKFSQFDTDNDISFYDTTSGTPVLDTVISNRFLYEERIYAGYINVNKKFSENFHASIGLRYENTSVEGNSITQQERFTNDYDNFFPSLSLSYDPSERNSFYLSYNKRILRPTLFDVNPFRVYQDAFNFSVGNPNLLPSITDNVELGYVYNGNLSLALFSSKIKDNTAYVTTVNNNQIIVTQPLNILTTYDTGIDLSYNWKILPRLNSFNSFNLTYQKSKSSNISFPDENLKGFNSIIASYNTLSLNEDRSNKVFVNAYYAFSGVEGIYQSKNVFMLRLGTSLSFLNRNLNINIYATDVFNTTIARNTIDFNEFILKNRIFNDNRSLSISATYKFGNNKSKQSNRDIDSSETDRINKD